MLSLAAGAIEELSKESPSSEVVEYKTKDFVKTLEVSACLVPPPRHTLETVTREPLFEASLEKFLPDSLVIMINDNYVR